MTVPTAREYDPQEEQPWDLSNSRAAVAAGAALVHRTVISRKPHDGVHFTSNKMYWLLVTVLMVMSGIVRSYCTKPRR
jgi:hypothetical protein